MSVKMETKADIKHEIHAILLQHHGRQNAITGMAIAHKLGFKENREVRRAIRGLINDGVPIASTTESPAGYYIIINREEVDIYMKRLRDLLIEDARRRRDFRVCAMRYLENVGQGRMI